MIRTVAPQKYLWLIGFIAVGIICLAAPQALSGPYRDSAHGNSGYGVNRSTIDGKYAAYATGNCAHCHETHASFEGVEPQPVGGPAPHALFADALNTARTENLYLETDNFCFYCHNDNSGPQVRNQDYSTTFGGGNTGDGPQSIFAAFNQISYHNLYDIWSFLTTDPVFGAWFANIGNPCSGCHNSHLAKRNWDNGQPGFPLLSTISMPGISGSLWGETQVMSGYISYEAPYALAITREPAGVGDQDGGGHPLALESRPNASDRVAERAVVVAPDRVPGDASAALLPEHREQQGEGEEADDDEEEALHRCTKIRIQP